jgi:hypothetical protein
MATYIQGVPAYVPQFQPYQPDLNFESGLLQQKQTQYDTNWKALNNVYGQYFYADLTRDPNIKKKEDLMKNIEFNLQRISGLDLSLSQNVDQAMQVFKPFYEDNVLMKDMAWTKTKNAQRSYGLSLKNDPDKNKSKMYWNDGIKAIDYLTDEFKNSSDEESMSFGNVTYTPYRHVMREALALAKESGISKETPSFSEDGRWMYQTKNGEQIMEPLSKLFEAELGSDPGIQDVFRTMAYVKRKDYVEENAAQFKGDKTAAEMRYLQDEFNVLKEQTQLAYKNTQNVSDTYDAKIQATEKAIKDGTARPGTEEYLANLKRNKEINDKVLARFRDQNEEYLGDEDASEKGFVNPYGDIKSLRIKVDNGVTWNALSKKLNEAAQEAAYVDYKVTTKENPYAVLDLKHQQDMQITRLRNAGTLAAVRARNEGEAKNIDRKWRLESGTSVLQDVTRYDEKTGQYVTSTELVENDAAFYARPGLGEGGNVTDELDVRKIQKHFSGKVADAYAAPYWNTTRDIFKKLEATTALSYEDLKRLQFGDRPLKKGEKVRSVDQFFNDMAAYSMNHPERMKQVKARIDGYLQAHANYPIISESKADYAVKAIGFESVIDYAENNADYTLKTSKLAQQELLRMGVEKKYLDLAIDQKTGRLRPPAEFQRLVDEKYGEDKPILHGSGEIYDPTTRKTISVTKQNYKDVTERIGKHIYENGSTGTNNTSFYKDGAKAKQRIQSALGTNEGVDAVFIDRTGKRISISDNREEIQRMLKSNKSYLIKQTQAGGWFSDNQYVITEVDPQEDKKKIYDQLGNGYVFNTWSNVRYNSDNKATAKYNEIQKAIGEAYSSSDIQKLGIPTLTGTFDPGTGLYAETSAITVLPKNRQAPGSIAMSQFMSQMQTMDLDGQRTLISLNGLDATAIDAAKGGGDFSQTAKGKFLIKQLQQSLNSPNQNKMSPFDIEYQSIAGNDLGTEAMIIRPSVEWLTQFQSSTKDADLDENGQGNNALTLAEFNAAVQHGISVVAPSGTFNNSLTAGAIMSPFASNVIYKSAQGQPVTYVDPYGSGSVQIVDDKQSQNFIISVGQGNDPNSTFSESIPYSKGEQSFYESIKWLDQLSQQNKNIYNN